MGDCEIYSIQEDVIYHKDVKAPDGYGPHVFLSAQATRLETQADVQPRAKKVLTPLQLRQREEANNEANRLYIEKKKKVRDLVKAWHAEHDDNDTYTLDIMKEREQANELKKIDACKALLERRKKQKDFLDDWYEGYLKRLEAYNYYSGLLKNKK